MTAPPANGIAGDAGRVDLLTISGLVAPGSRVLDIGSGDGALLKLLEATRQVDGRGIEISQKGVNECVARGLSVVQGDADTDLVDYPDAAFDYVILSQTLQATHRPRHVVEQMLRIGRKAIVSFPNFGQWRVRGALRFTGRMPVTRSLPYSWYDTPNIHFCTIRDFVALCSDVGAEVEQQLVLGPAGADTAGDTALVLEPVRPPGGVRAEEVARRYWNRIVNPGKGSPKISLRQVSPGATGSAFVTVPVVTMSPGSKRSPLTRSRPSTKWASADSGPPRTFAPCPRSMSVPSRWSASSKPASRSSQSLARRRRRAGRKDRGKADRAGRRQRPYRRPKISTPDRSTEPSRSRAPPRRGRR